MYTGLTGALKIPNALGGYTTLAYIKDFSIEDTAEVIETTKLGRRYKDAIQGVQSWSASANGAITFEGNNNHTALFNAKHFGEKIKLRFYLNNVQTNSNEEPSTYFEGEGYIESLSVDLSAEDKGNISISIKGTGRLKLFVDGIEVITGELKPSDIEFFKMRVDNNGNLYVIVENVCPFNFELREGYLIALMGA